MKLHPSESIIVETVGGRMLRISVDAECGDDSIKITDLGGVLVVGQIFSDRIRITSLTPREAAAQKKKS